jgi:diacylglycerol kinase (ATP)
MRIVRATGYSLVGLRAAFRSEPAFRQELAFAVVLVPLAFFVGRDLVETALLIVTLVIVLIVELINSAIEANVDRIGPERTELSGRAKDIGSAAVLLALILVITVWSLVLLARLGF